MKDPKKGAEVWAELADMSPLLAKHRQPLPQNRTAPPRDYFQDLPQRLEERLAAEEELTEISPFLAQHKKPLAEERSGPPIGYFEQNLLDLKKNRARKKKNRLWPKIGLAASVALLAGAASFWLLNNPRLNSNSMAINSEMAETYLLAELDDLPMDDLMAYVDDNTLDQLEANLLPPRNGATIETELLEETNNDELQEYLDLDVLDDLEDDLLH
ncbi:hypothetical protein SapgrDRAFT_1148 [Saprospira grandis DSM 2844]|uniref:Uncharacterized protein n=2 Tax=Saprospira TaxID=1007 RepID=J0P5Y4_9BACT|nr:hypothetical protein SapgrDRAFT_1148 [Saprospira grandis DSM 2844]